MDMIFEEVSFSYGNNMILHQVSFRVPHGEFLAIIGPNGGGKTTLVKLALGLLKPDRGSISILGDLPGRSVHRVGYVPQDLSQADKFPITVIDAVLMGRSGRSGKMGMQKQDRRKALEAMDMMGVGHLEHSLVGSLSMGLRQRVMIARALTTDPDMLILDEPTASVDQDTQKNLYENLLRLNREKTIVVVSHDLFAVTSHATAVACVNRKVCYHSEGEIKPEMLELAYGTCPVELIAHGLPHRVLGRHSEKGETPDV
ncbi:MAG TPA: ABC transporter ATP-binding protein [Synergistales bacterium]|nr:ABC transporter ATP-binding protein [Synergistales bacterium]